MARFGIFSGGKDDNADSDAVSDGSPLQCDCPKNGCPCTRWGNWIPKGHTIPNVVLCDQCKTGNHSG